MKYTIINVPDMNDSMARITLQNRLYMVRFTYNDTGDYWNFGLYTDLKEPIAIGMKIVPNVPVNLFFGRKEMPVGAFLCTGKIQRASRNVFKEGKALFIYIPPQDEES